MAFSTTSIISETIATFKRLMVITVITRLHNSFRRVCPWFSRLMSEHLSAKNPKRKHSFKKGSAALRGLETYVVMSSGTVRSDHGVGGCSRTDIVRIKPHILVVNTVRLPRIRGVSSRRAKRKMEAVLVVNGAKCAFWFSLFENWTSSSSVTGL